MGKASPRSRVFYGWWVVAAAAAISFYSSGVFFYGFGPFFNPILDEFGWTRATTSIVFALRSMEMGFLAPLFGFLVDRFGARRLMSLGAAVAGLGFVLLSQINSLWTFLGAFTVVTLGFDAMMGVVTMTVVSQWFVRRRGVALGILSAGAGFSGLVVPLITLVIATAGWRTTFAILGIGLWVFCLPLAFLLIRDRPEQHGLFPDGDASPLVGSSEEGRNGGQGDLTLKQAVQTRSFWLLSLAFLVGSAAQNALVSHQIPFFVSIGYSRATSSFLVAIMTTMGAAGRPGFGWIADRLNKRYVLVVLFALQGVGVLIFAGLGSTWQLVLFLLTFSPAYGAILALRGVVFGDYFGRSSLGAILGASSLIVTLGGMFSPVYAGAVFDAQGSYRVAFLVLGAIALAAVPAAFLSFKPRKKGAQVPRRESAGAIET